MRVGIIKISCDFMRICAVIELNGTTQMSAGTTYEHRCTFPGACVSRTFAILVNNEQLC